MAQRIAGGERHDALAGFTCSDDPARHLAEGAIHVLQHGACWQMLSNQLERPLGADHQIGRDQALARGVGKSAPCLLYTSRCV